MGIFRLYDVDGTGGVDEDEFEVLFTVLRYPKEFTREEVLMRDAIESGERVESSASGS